MCRLAGSAATFVQRSGSFAIDLLASTSKLLYDSEVAGTVWSSPRQNLAWDGELAIEKRESKKKWQGSRMSKP